MTANDSMIWIVGIVMAVMIAMIVYSSALLIFEPGVVPQLSRH
jgi:hypothetical protein